MNDTLMTIITSFGSALVGAVFGGLFSIWVARKTAKDNHMQEPTKDAEKLIVFIARQSINANEFCSRMLETDDPDLRRRYERALFHFSVEPPKNMWEKNNISFDRYLTSMITKETKREDCLYTMWGIMTELNNLAIKMQDKSVDEFLTLEPEALEPEALEPDLIWLRDFLVRLHKRWSAMPDDIPLLKKYSSIIKKKGEEAGMKFEEYPLRIQKPQKRNLFSHSLPLDKLRSMEKDTRLSFWIKMSKYNMKKGHLPAFKLLIICQKNS